MKIAMSIALDVDVSQFSVTLFAVALSLVVATRPLEVRASIVMPATNVSMADHGALSVDQINDFGGVASNDNGGTRDDLPVPPISPIERQDVLQFGGAQGGMTSSSGPAGSTVHCLSAVRTSSVVISLNDCSQRIADALSISLPDPLCGEFFRPPRAA